MKPSSCRICQTSCSELSKCHDPVLGFVCSDCHEFSLNTDKVLRRRGIEGFEPNPVRYKPETQES